MKCKDCGAGFLVKPKDLDCKNKIVICLVAGEPEVIATKYWEDEDGCEGV